MTATHILTNLVIKEISLVDDGDNRDAHVVIAKRRGAQGSVIAKHAPKLNALTAAIEKAVSEGEAGPEAADAVAFLKSLGVDMDEIEKKLAEIEASLATVTKRAEDAEAEVAKLKAENATLTADIAKGKTDDTSDEAVLKAMPAAARTMIEKARADAALATAAVEKMRDEQETAASIEKAKGLGVQDAVAVGGLLHRIAKGKTTPEDAGALEGVLKAMGEQAKSITTPLGSAVEKVADPAAALQAKADEIHKANPAMTKEAAYTAAVDANPALYDQYIGKRRAA